MGMPGVYAAEGISDATAAILLYTYLCHTVSTHSPQDGIRRETLFRFSLHNLAEIIYDLPSHIDTANKIP